MQVQIITHMSTTVKIYSYYLIIQTAALFIISPTVLSEWPQWELQVQKIPRTQRWDGKFSLEIMGSGLLCLSALEAKPDSAGV